MKVGIYIPQVGGAAAPEHIVRIARAAEAAGFDSLWTFDHVVLRPDQGSDYPYTEDGRFLIPAETAFLEPLTLMTYVAAVTERVELGTAVLVLPMRAPVLHAKLIATLDHLAGGRVILGAGVGWWKEEFEALSMPFDRRGARMDEYLAVLRDLWENEIGSFEGEFYNTAGWYSRPQPPRRVPIWLGGNHPRQLARAGRLADGYLANPAMLDTIEADWDRVRQIGERPRPRRVGAEAGDQPDHDPRGRRPGSRRRAAGRDARDRLRPRDRKSAPRRRQPRGVASGVCGHPPGRPAGRLGARIQSSRCSLA